MSGASGMVPWTGPDGEPTLVSRTSGATTRPAGLCSGAGHIVVYGNPAFVSSFGVESVGLPAREGMLGLPAEAFELFDAVLREGRPLARWVSREGDQWRLTAMPRFDPDSRAPYGVAFHLRLRADLPVVLE
ncbi:MAG: hypothetical protein ACJ77F_07675 [Chloroflexota bacterium]